MARPKVVRVKRKTAPRRHAQPLSAMGDPEDDLVVARSAWRVEAESWGEKPPVRYRRPSALGQGVDRERDDHGGDRR